MMLNTRRERRPPASGTYFIQDEGLSAAQRQKEVLRLLREGQLLTAKMGGVLVEHIAKGPPKCILDVACGPGGWVIEAAQRYPGAELVGIDFNPRMIKYARAQASKHQVKERISFQVMDALQPLGFATASFDLINLRFASRFVRTWEWPALIRELLRVLHPGGVVHLADEEVVHPSNSPAVMQFSHQLVCALWRAGHLFTEASNGATAHLASQLLEQGCQQIQTQTQTLHYRADIKEDQVYAQDRVGMMQMLRPFLQQWGCLPNDIERIRNLALKEVRHPDFSAAWHIQTAWGTKPESCSSP